MRRATGVATPTRCVRMEDLQSQGPTGGLRGGAGRGGGGTWRQGSGGVWRSTIRVSSNGGGKAEEALPREETPKPAASLTCQTLAPRTDARTPPECFLSCRTQLQPLPELQDARGEGGTEAGKAATGPKPREAYIGGAKGSGRQLCASPSHR